MDTLRLVELDRPGEDSWRYFYPNYKRGWSLPETRLIYSTGDESVTFNSHVFRYSRGTLTQVPSSRVLRGTDYETCIVDSLKILTQSFRTEGKVGTGLKEDLEKKTFSCSFL